LAADQVTAEDKEKIDTDPAETIDAAGQFESKKRCVINDYDDDRKCAKKIEARLAFAILKAWIDSELATASLRFGRWSLSCRLMNVRE
jgi:hypothetical protein